MKKTFSKPACFSSPKKGVALILVLVSMALIAVVSVEIMFTSRIELRIGRNARDRMQASYLARSAAKFGLLRLYMFREIHNLKVSGKIPKEAVSDEMIDRIWSMPFPAFPFPGATSVWPGTLSMTIDTEGSKIPINLLDANIYRNSNKTMAEQVQNEIINLFKGLMEDESFYDLYRDLEPTELVENLIDWLDKDSDRVKGGDENSLYDKGERPVFPRNDRLTSLTELNMVSGWTDDLVKRLAPSFSVINTSLKVNPNHIPIPRIKSYCPKLTAEDLLIVQRRRAEKPFADIKALVAFIDSDPEIKNGRGCTFPEKLESSLEERIFYLNGSATVGDATRSLKLGVRIEDEAKVDPNANPANPSTPGAATPPPDPPPTDAKAKGPAKMAEPRVITIEETI